MDPFRNEAAVINYVRKVYGNRPVGVQLNLLRMLQHGQTANTLLAFVGAADQMRGVHNVGKYAHRPRLFDPGYIYELFGKCGASIAALHPEAIKDIPYELRMKYGMGLMYKLNAQNGLDSSVEPQLIGNVKEAVELGCIGIGYTINHSTQLYELKQISAEAHAAGLPVYTWAYPRFSGLKVKKMVDDGKGGQVEKTIDYAQALDVTVSAIGWALDGGSDVIKAKNTKNLLFDESLRTTCYAEHDLSNDRVRESQVKVTMNGRLLVESGGETAWGDEKAAAEDAWLERITETAPTKNGGAVGRQDTLEEDIPAAVRKTGRIITAYANGLTKYGSLV